MIPQHVSLIEKLSLPQVLALWTHLRQCDLVYSSPPHSGLSASLLAEECSTLSHAQIVMSLASKTEPFWCDLISALLERPIYLCARGETGIPLTDIEGRPLPLPIGHRRGQAPGTGGLPKRVANRVQYQRKHDPRVIVSVVEKNPKIPSTKAYDRFSLYRVGMTVSEYISIGGTPADIVHDVGKGFIVVDIP